MSRQNQQRTPIVRFLGPALALLILAAVVPVVAAAAGDDGPTVGPVGARAAAKLLPPRGYLGLDEGQQEAARALFAATRAKVQPLREDGKALRLQLREAVDAPQPDATAVGDLVLALADVRGQAKDILLGAEAEFLALLDAEQTVKYENWRELRQLRRDNRRGGGEGDAPAGADFGD
ncbi:MAG: periplasmic heavy metal sensor [Acidobacteriota bacterium]